jgi:hypothetical protein
MERNEVKRLELVCDSLPEGVDAPSRYVLRLPGRQELHRFVKASGDNAIIAATNLVLACAEEPPRELLAPVLERLPVLAVKLSGELQNALGGGLDFTASVR